MIRIDFAKILTFLFSFGQMDELVVNCKLLMVKKNAYSPGSRAPEVSVER